MKSNYLLYSMSILMLFSCSAVFARVTEEVQTPMVSPIDNPYEKPGFNPAMPDNGGMQPPSPEEFAQWYQEVNKEVDQFKSTLSEDDRKQFDTEVENLTKIMTDILETEGPEGLDKFIDSLFQAEGQMPEAPVAEEEVKTPVVETPEVKTPEKAKEPEVPSKGVEAAAKMVEDLIFHTERFLRKSEIIPELPGKIERWVEKGKIKEWKADVTWETLKSRIETLNKRFHDLQDRDPKTKQYKFMSHLVQNESLYNNMSHLLAVLTQHESKAEAPAFGLGKVTDKSRAALREVLGGYMEALYKLDIPQQIEKLIEKYEPRAKELREEEETSRKKAHEESKKPRVEGAKKETPAGESYYGGGAGYPGGAGAGEYQPYGGYTPGTGYYDTGYPYQEGGYYDQGGGTPAGHTSEAKGGKEAGKPGAKGGKEEGTPGAGGSSKVKTDPSIKRLVDKVDTALDDVMEKIGETKLATIESHMTDGSAVDADLAIITLPLVIRKFKSIIDQVKTIKSKAGHMSNAQKDQAMQELRAIATGHKAMLDSLISQITTIKTKLPSINADKQYAYFGGKARDKATKETVTKIPQPVSLQDLADALEQFNTEVGPYGAQAEESKTKTTSGSRPGASRVPGSAGAAESAHALASEQEGEEEEETVTTAPRTPAPTRADLNRQAQKIDTGLEKAQRIIEDNAKLRNIQAHITDATQPVDAHVIKAINDATREFKDVGVKFEQLKKDFDALPEAQQKANKAVAEQVMTALQENPDLIESMGKQLTATTAPGFAVSREKRYAYLGGAMPAGTSKVDAAALAKQFPQTASLKDLLDAMAALYQPAEPEVKAKRATAGR